MPPLGYPGHFRNSDRATFSHEVTEGEAEWWNRIVRERTGLYPDDIPGFLASGTPGRASGRYTRFDADAEVFVIEMQTQAEDNTRIAFKAKRFEVAGGIINSGETRVHPDWQGGGIGTKLMMNLIDLAASIRAKRVEIEAQDIGRYAWLQMGFLPDKTSWVDRIIPRVKALAGAMFATRQIDQVTLRNVLDIVSEPDPRVAREMLTLTAPVPGLDRRGQPADVTLCKALMLQQGTDWNGSFEIDEETLDFLEAYKEAHDAKHLPTR